MKTTKHCSATKIPLSPDQRVVLAYIKQHGPVTPKELRDRFRALANAAGDGCAKWLGPRLESLEARGYIECATDSDGRMTGWSMVPGAWELALANVGDGAAKLSQMAEDTRTVAQPRRTSMFGDTYKPPCVGMRPGAMDYAAVPSLHMGQRRAFRSEAQ